MRGVRAHTELLLGLELQLGCHHLCHEGQQSSFTKTQPVNITPFWFLLNGYRQMSGY